MEQGWIFQVSEMIIYDYCETALSMFAVVGIVEEPLHNSAVLCLQIMFNANKL